MTGSTAYGWVSARLDFEEGVYPARVAKWLGVTESDVWKVAEQEGWKRPSVATLARESDADGGWLVPPEMAPRFFVDLSVMDWSIEGNAEPWPLAVAWRDLPPVAWLTPFAFAALSLLSQVVR